MEQKCYSEKSPQTMIKASIDIKPLQVGFVGSSIIIH